jgi:Protein of unknown function (DUF4089)
MTDDKSAARGLIELAGQEIPAEYRDEAARQLAALLVQARLVEEFQLPDEPQ